MKRFGYCTVVAVLLLTVFFGFAFAATIYIKPDGTGDVATIQDGIAAAADGDSVLLAAGTYTGAGNRDVDFLGKTITVTSESGPDATVIDCQALGGAFVFSWAPSYSPVLSGLTIRNASVVAVFCDDGAVATISGNIFVENNRAIRCVLFSRAVIRGNTFVRNTGAIGADDYVEILDNVFIENTSSRGGAVNCIFEAACTITGNVFIRNTATEMGGAVYTDAGGLIVNNTFYENSAPAGSGIYVAPGMSQSMVRIRNTIIAFGEGGAGIECADIVPPVLSCNNIFGNAGGDALCGTDNGGNFSADPEFCGMPGTDNCFLQSDSPCAPGNHPLGESCGLIGALSVGCGYVKTETKTWGEIKDMYKND